MFRRTTPQIKGQGGLFDTAYNIYNNLPKNLRPTFKHQALEAKFPSGAKVKWTHMEHVKDKYNHQGLQYTFVGIDEGCQFEWEQIEYLMSRLRSESKYKSRMVISCNPDPDHKLCEIISWHLDEEGYPIPERDGVVRYFIRRDGEFIWGDTEQELKDKYGENCLPLSFSFISARIYDNPPMLQNNAEYLAFLEGLNEVDKAQLLHGNWFTRLRGSNYFLREWLKPADKVPLGCVSMRAYDKAGTEPSQANPAPDYTASIKMYKDKSNYIYIAGDWCPDFKDPDSEILGRFRKRAGERDRIITTQAAWDGSDCTIVFPQDVGQAGLSEYHQSAGALNSLGYIVKKDSMPGNKSKLTRFTPFASACENGHVYILKHTFNPKTLEAFLKELEVFDGERSTTSRKDDWADAVASCFNTLSKQKVIPQFTMSLPASNSRIASIRDL